MFQSIYISSPRASLDMGATAGGVAVSKYETSTSIKCWEGEKEGGRGGEFLKLGDYLVWRTRPTKCILW